jgi:hypothetical protein
MITEEQGRLLLASIQSILPEDCKFQLIIARADLDKGDIQFCRVSELPKDGANLMLDAFMRQKTENVADDFDARDGVEAG